MLDLENGMVVGNLRTDNGAEPYPERTVKDFPPDGDLETAAQVMERIRKARNFLGGDTK